MKATVVVKKEVEITYLAVKAEDIEVENYVRLSPIDEDGNWCPKIDVSNGKIVNWEHNEAVSIHEKVRDSGSYTLIDSSGKAINDSENDYVPKCMCPQDSGYGDYIIMDISEEGFIQGWKFGQSDVDEIMGVEED